ncbi:unnamed protein product [Arabidopsis halleri]
MVGGVWSDERSLQLQATTQFRKLLSIGMTAPQAVGVIHSDFEKGFIRAETVSYEDFVTAGSIAAAREKGLLRSEGKDLRLLIPALQSIGNIVTGDDLQTQVEDLADIADHAYRHKQILVMVALTIESVVFNVVVFKWK